MILADGLYQVTTRYLCAGFVVEDGQVTIVAPILRKRLNYWKTIAKPITIKEVGQCGRRRSPGQRMKSRRQSN